MKIGDRHAPSCLGHLQSSYDPAKHPMKRETRQSDSCLWMIFQIREISKGLGKNDSFHHINLLWLSDGEIDLGKR